MIKKECVSSRTTTFPPIADPPQVLVKIPIGKFLNILICIIKRKKKESVQEQYLLLINCRSSPSSGQYSNWQVNSGINVLKALVFCCTALYERMIGNEFDLKDLSQVLVKIPSG